ncbi:MAG: RNA 2',3'-cyclic phosphodiesterase [Clostridiaceae bacterium]|nr:RNA 2',3'-cyclic phosphodiesterase [Clostridiaceae bacterium]
MRSFIAIDFDRELKTRIAGLQSEIRRYAVSGRWKHIDNFHLTLKFLGEINPNSVENINRILAGICSSFSPFKLSFSTLGYFPGQEKIRVLWLGLEGDLDKLLCFQKTIDAGLKEEGFEPEKRRFTPHVTIGQDIVLNSVFESIMRLVDPKELPEIRVRSIYLFKSEQINFKRIYTPISEFCLI